MRAVQISAFGGPEVLHLTEVDEPVPGPGEVLIDVHSAGVNYADTHQTEDSYLARQTLPLIPGGEVVGRVVGGERAGERVLAMVDGGGYAERAVAKSDLAYPLDDRLTDAQALALIIQGTSAWHLLRTSTHFSPGETVVVHSAAGGVGNIAVQLARAWGAGRIIGTASGPEKCALVESLGADVALDISSTENAGQVTEALRAANHGRPIDVVLEMTGGHVFDGSLAALRPLGRLAVFGMASRVPPTRIQVPALMAKSRAVIGFWLVHALSLPGGLQAPLEELTSMIRAGRLNPVTGDSYPLADAAKAHEALLSRRTIGKLVLQVQPDPGPASARSVEEAQPASSASSAEALSGGAPSGEAPSAEVPSGGVPSGGVPSTGVPSPVASAAGPATGVAAPVAQTVPPELILSPASRPTTAPAPPPRPAPTSAQAPASPAETPSTGAPTPAWANLPTTEPTAAQLAAVESFGSAS